MNHRYLFIWVVMPGIRLKKNNLRRLFQCWLSIACNDFSTFSSRPAQPIFAFYFIILQPRFRKKPYSYQSSLYSPPPDRCMIIKNSSSHHRSTSQPIAPTPIWFPFYLTQCSPSQFQVAGYGARIQYMTGTKQGRERCVICSYHQQQRFRSLNLFGKKIVHP